MYLQPIKFTSEIRETEKRHNLFTLRLHARRQYELLFALRV